MKSKTFCPIPFHHAIVKPNNTVGVCCSFQQEDHFRATGDYLDGRVSDFDNIEDYLYTENHKHIQQQMLRGEKVHGCLVCYERERLGYDSMRTKELEGLSNKFNNFSIEAPVLSFLEITFGNYCNLSCRSCIPELSTSWIKESAYIHNNTSYGNYFKNLENKKTDVEREFNLEEFENLELIKITGGEPMLHPNFYKFLGGLKQDQMECEIFTNASHIPKKRLLDALLKFKRVKLFVSIDDINEGQEYLRNNANWDTTEKSIIKWLHWIKENPTKTSITLAPTFSIYNADSFKRLLDWWLETVNNILGPMANDNTSSVTSNILNRPEWMQMCLHKRKDELKREAYFYIKYLKKSNLYGSNNVIGVVEGFINYLNANVDHEILNYRDDFVNITKILDATRSQDVQAVYPKLYNDFKEEFEKVGTNRYSELGRVFRISEK
jgi:organic radical activating enzyme